MSLLLLLDGQSRGVPGYLPGLNQRFLDQHPRYHASTVNSLPILYPEESGAAFKLYLDGTLMGTITDADATRSINQVGNVCGARCYTTYNSGVPDFLIAKIADLIVDNAALSDADIAWLANDENYLI